MHMMLLQKQIYFITTTLILGCCVLFFVPDVVNAQGLINTSGCEVPGADTGGQCRNVEILLVQAISLIEYLFGIIGTLAFVMFVYGGLKMILAFGSEDKFKEGKEAMVNAVIGMIIAFSAYILVNFTLDVLGVKGGFRAVGSGSSAVQEQEDDKTLATSSVNTACTTSADCGNVQLICREGACVPACKQVGGSCGVWNATSCAAPKTIQRAYCPDNAAEPTWACCVPPIP